MSFPSNKSIYPYLFLLGNCSVWYGTGELHNELFFLLVLIPFLAHFKLGRMLIIVIAGCCFTEFTALQQQWSFPENITSENHLLTGTIEGLPQHNGDIVRLRFKINSINHQNLFDDLIYFRLGCYRHCPEFKADQSWQLLVRLKPPNGYLNPGGFDYEKWLYAAKFKATGYIVSSTSNQLLSTEKGIDSSRQTIRRYLIDNINNSVTRGSAIALTIGDKSHLANSDQQLLAASGLSHLMAISGLHIGLSAIPAFILAGLLWKSFRPFQYFNCSNFQWFVCIFPALGYAAVSGFGLPAKRALIMLLVFAFVHLRRYSMSIHSRFCIALWIILLTQPLAPLQITFWLSFCATASLILLSQLIIVTNPFAQLVYLQSRLFILLMPIQLLLFGSISLMSPLLNLLAIPFVSFILLPILLLLIFMILLSLPATEYVLWLAEQLLSLFWTVLEFLTPLIEQFKFTSDNFTLWHLLVYPLLITLQLPFDFKAKLLILLLILMLQNETKPTKEFRMMVFDVGQGLAISVDYNDKLLLYDTAYGSPDFTVAEMTILPWLNDRNKQSIDLLVVGHNDADHSGGLASLVGSVEIKELLVGSDVKVSKAISLKQSAIKRCHQGQKWQWSDLSINVISPMKVGNEFTDGNDSSCVLLLTLHDTTILITGDIEVAAEKQLLDNYPELHVDIVFAPHHGSKTSSSSSFVQQMDPQVALISSGYLNRFNFPSKKVIKRYTKQGVRLFNTAYSGAIELTIDGDENISIKQWRLDNLRLWRRH